MLDITIRATKAGQNYIEQVHQISVFNIASLEGGVYEYNIYLDGKSIGMVRHRRKDGALELTRIVMQYIGSRMDL